MFVRFPQLCLSCFVIVLTITIGFSQQPKHERQDRKLQKKLEELCKDFQGIAGIYVHHLRTGKTAQVNADSLFPTASLIKVPILMAMMNRIEKNEIRIDSELIYRDSLLYTDHDIVGKFRDSSKISVGQVMMLMITTSDNTASLWCQKIAGTGIAINQLLEANGFQYTRVNSRTPGREKIWRQYGWGQTTPREMTLFLQKMYKGELISAEASEQMYRYLGRIYWDGEALSQIPPSVNAASKQGAVNQSRSEVVMVNAPHGDYVFCVITKNQKDTSWKIENEGYVLIRNVSRLLWQYFEPKSKWRPSGNTTKWYK
jgi:beta-lactamase class A